MNPIRHNRVLPPLAFFMLVSLLWAGCMPASDQEGSARPAAPRLPQAPAMQEVTVRSLPEIENVHLAAHQGKVILLDFWASWSPACVHELPRLEHLYQELKDDDFVVIGMAVDTRDADDVARVVREQGISYPVGLAGPDLLARYGGIRAVPTKLLVDRKGVIRESYMGVRPVDEIREAILALLNE